MTKNRCFAILIASGLGLPLSACSSQSSTVAKPIWIANNINGLQGSTCHCGGIYPKKLTKAQKKAQRRAEKDAR